MKFLHCLIHFAIVEAAVLRQASSHSSGNEDVIEKRQTHSTGHSGYKPSPSTPTVPTGLFQNGLSSLMKIDKAFKVTTIPSQLRKEAKRVKILFGPYTLAAFNKSAPVLNIPFNDPGATMWMSALDGMPKDATYLYAKSSIAFEDGSEAAVNNGVYVHHLAVMDLDYKGASQLSVCPGRDPNTPSRGRISGGTLFTGGAEDKGDTFFTSGDGKFNSGFYIGKNDRIMSGAEVINYRTVSQKVYVQLELEYVEGKISDALEVSAQSVSVTGCAMNISFMPKKNETSLTLKSQEFPVVQEGYIISSKGHLHDGGLNVILKVNGKVVCESKAIYGGEAGTATATDGTKWETIGTMTKCREPIPVKRGDKLAVEANYDLAKHPPRQNAHGAMSDQMGFLFIYFAAKF